MSTNVVLYDVPRLHFFQGELSTPEIASSARAVIVLYL